MKEIYTMKTEEKTIRNWMIFMGVFGYAWIMFYNWAFILVVKNVYYRFFV